MTGSLWLHSIIYVARSGHTLMPDICRWYGRKNDLECHHGQIALLIGQIQVRATSLLLLNLEHRGPCKFGSNNLANDIAKAAEHLMSTGTKNFGKRP